MSRSEKATEFRKVQSHFTSLQNENLVIKDKYELVYNPFQTPTIKVRIIICFC